MKINIPKVNFSFFKKKGSWFDFVSISNEISFKNSIIPITIIIVIAVLIIINSGLGGMLNEGNLNNDKLYNSINKAIPQKQLEQLITEKKNIDEYDNMKTSLTVYEIWNFLSRIIPKNNSASSVNIDGPNISFTYTDVDFTTHLSLMNTLADLKNKGLIKSYESKSINGIRGDDLATTYSTVITLDAGIDKDVGVRKFINSDTKTFEYRSVLDSNKGTDIEKAMIKIRTFLEQNSQGVDATLSEYLQFKR